MFQRASIFEYVVAWFLMAGVWVLWTAGCGAMLALQDHQMNARQQTAVEDCNDAASRAARLASSAPDNEIGPELAHGTRGLRPEYLTSAPARAVFARCLEDRDRWAAMHVGGV